MADTRTTTTLDIKVNARALGGLQQTLKQVFSRQTPREFNTAIGEVNRSLEKNARQTMEVVTALGKVSKGTEAYKKLKDQLKEANREGQQLRNTLDNLDRTYQRMGKSAAAAAPGGTGRGGMMGGAMAAARGAPQIPMPGMGAMATALGAIPIAGLAAAGSLMAAAQTYQSRLRFEQSRLEAAPFLMSSREALGFRPSTRMVDVEQPEQAMNVGPGGVIKPRVAGQLVNEVGTDAVRAVGAAGLTEAELGAAFRTRRRAALEQTLGKGAGGAYAGVLESSFMTGFEEVTGLGAVGRDITEDQILAEQRRLRDRTAPTLAEVIGTDADAAAARERREAALAGADPFVRLAAERTQAIEGGTAGPAQRRVRDQPFDSQAFVRAGIGMGVAPAQALQMAGQLGQAAGRPVDPEEFRQALALQRTTGIGVGQTGQAIRQLRYAGEIGGMGGGNMEQVANLIGSAVALGLEGSEIGEYLQAQTGFLGQMVNQGIGVDIDKMRALEASISQSGIGAPWRGADISRQFVTGAAQVGREGATSAEQFRLMRAFGFTGEGGLEEFFKIRMGMQSQGLADEMGMRSPQEAMSAFIEQFRIQGAGEMTQAGVLQRAFKGIGTTIGPEEAMAMAKGLKAAEPGAFEIDPEAAERLVSTVAPSVKAEAGIEAERVAIGGQVAGAMQDLERTTNNMAKTFENVLGPVLDAFAAQLEDTTGLMAAATEGGVFGQTLDPLGVRMNP